MQRLTELIHTGKDEEVSVGPDGHRSVTGGPKSGRATQISQPSFFF